MRVVFSVPNFTPKGYILKCRKNKIVQWREFIVTSYVWFIRLLILIFVFKCVFEKLPFKRLLKNSDEILDGYKKVR